MARAAEVMVPPRQGLLPLHALVFMGVLVLAGVADAARTNTKFMGAAEVVLGVKPPVGAEDNPGCLRPGESSTFGRCRAKGGFPSLTASCECKQCALRIELSCGSDGKWYLNGGVDLCHSSERFGCGRCRPPDRLASVLRCNQSDKPGFVGEKRRCTCRGNCRGVTLSCTQEGRWHVGAGKNIGECAAMVLPTQFLHKERMFERLENGTFHYWCHEGMQLQGAERVQCEQGLRIGATPFCADAPSTSTTSTPSPTPPPEATTKLETTLLTPPPTTGIPHPPTPPLVHDPPPTTPPLENTRTPTPHLSDDPNSNTVALEFRQRSPEEYEPFHFPDRIFVAPTRIPNPYPLPGFPGQVRPTVAVGRSPPLPTNSPQKGKVGSNKMFPVKAVAAAVAVLAVLVVVGVVLCVLSRHYRFVCEKGTSRFDTLIGFTTDIKDSYILPNNEHELAAIRAKHSTRRASKISNNNSTAPI